jgi:hypothetical protein
VARRGEGVRGFGESELAKEFEAELELSSQALRAAKAIRDDLGSWKESTEDRREKKDAKLAEAKGIDVAKRRELAGLRAARKLAAAAKLCDLVASEKRQKDDPFFAIVTWEWRWVSPDKSLTAPFDQFPEIKKVVDESRNYFKGEQDAIVTEAKEAGEAVIKAAEAVTDQADPASIETALQKLQEILKFGEDGGDGNAEIQTLVNRARAEMERLERIRKDRGGKALLADRTSARDLQRRLSSLDPEQQPNSIMICDFTTATAQWNQLLARDEIKTDLYRRFAKERIATASWCEFLFARFQADLEATAKGVDPKPLTTLAVDRVPFAGKDLLDAMLTAKDSGRYKFALLKAYNGQTSWDYAKFPMDWVYNSIFLHKGAPRWREMTPDLHFALGAFCFETMQYKDAGRHFEEVLKTGDQRLGAAARSLKARAELEAKARQAYEGLLRELDAAKTAAAVTDVMKKVNAYTAEHEGTLFYLDVMDPKDPVKVDYFRDDFPETPPAPPPPEPRGE